MSAHGLFVGLATLDLIYLVEALPQPNQKIVALDSAIAAGGPATNAAVAFQHLGSQATLAAVVGQHALGHLIQADLAACGVALVDLSPEQTEPPPASSVFVTRATGDRAVVSLNAVRRQASVDCLPTNLLPDTAVVLVDGHQLAVGQQLAQQAHALKIPIVLDAGSWKQGLEAVLPLVDYAICSANFHPPGCDSIAEVFAYLTALGIPQIAISRGGEPIQCLSRGETRAIAVPAIAPVDTVGAGDVLHGAFCHYILEAPFLEAIAAAAEVAARSCQSFGTRAWMEVPALPDRQDFT